MKKVIFMLASTLTLLSNCTFPSNTTITNKKGNLENTLTANDKLKSEFMEKFKNKKNINIDDIDISINTLSMDNKKETNKIFQVLSNKSTGIIRKKTFLLGENATNNSHIRDKDTNIFNPNDTNSIKDFIPELGDTVIPELKMKISKTNINNKGDILFEAGKVVISFSKPEGLEIFKNLYNAKVVRQVENFYEFEIDLSKSPINNVESILKKYSAGLPINIDSIEFSSLESMQTFIAVIDFLTTRYDLIESIELNIMGKSKIIKTYPISKNYDGDNYIFNNTQFGDPNKVGFPSRVGLPPKYNSSSPKPNPSGDILSSWWLAVPHVETAHKISRGKNVTAAIIDSGRYVLSHPEMNDTSSNSRIILNSRNSNQFLDWEFIFDGSSIAEKYHAMMCTFAGFGSERSRDLEYNTMGIATQSKVIPYRSFFPISWADDINHALDQKVDVISLSMEISVVQSIQTDILYWVIPQIGIPIKSIAKPSSLEALINKAYDLDKPVVIAAGEVDIVAPAPLDNIYDSSSNFEKAISVGAVSPLYVDSDLPDAKISFNSFIDSFYFQKKFRNEFINSLSNSYLRLNTFSSNNNLSESQFALSVAPFSFFGTNIKVWAPGTYTFHPNPDSKNNQTIPFDGTSIAAPIVAGTISLMKEVKKDLTSLQIIDILKKASITPIKSSKWMKEKLRFSDYNVVGQNMLDIFEAVNLTAKLAGKVYLLDYFDVQNETLSINNGGKTINFNANSNPVVPSSSSTIYTIDNNNLPIKSIIGIALAGDTDNCQITATDSKGITRNVKKLSQTNRLVVVELPEMANGNINLTIKGRSNTQQLNNSFIWNDTQPVISKIYSTLSNNVTYDTLENGGTVTIEGKKFNPLVDASGNKQNCFLIIKNLLTNELFKYDLRSNDIIDEKTVKFIFNPSNAISTQDSSRKLSNTNNFQLILIQFYLF